MNILITGARSNIGYNIAKNLSLKGHIVYAGCKTIKEKEMLENRIKDEKVIMFPIVLNLLDNNFNFINNFSLDAIILHASIGNGGSLIELSEKRFNEVIEVNIKGNFKLLQEYLHYCYYNNKKGKVFITSSLAAYYTIPYLGSYTASKAYLINIAKTLRLEFLYQKIDISVSLILPGAYHTGFNDVIIENKEKDNYILDLKAKKMTKYQKILFSLIEQIEYHDLINDIIKEIESNRPKFIISRPYLQRLFTKIYIIFKAFIV